MRGPLRGLGLFPFQPKLILCAASVRHAEINPVVGSGFNYVWGLLSYLDQSRLTVFLISNPFHAGPCPLQHIPPLRMR